MTHQAASLRLLLASQQHQHAFFDVHGQNSRILHVFTSTFTFSITWTELEKWSKHFTLAKALSFVGLHAHTVRNTTTGTRGQKLLMFQNTSLFLSTVHLVMDLLYKQLQKAFVKDSLGTVKIHLSKNMANYILHYGNKA